MLTHYLVPNQVNWNINLSENLTIEKYFNKSKIEETLNNVFEKDKDKDVILLTLNRDYLKFLIHHPKTQKKIRMLGYKPDNFNKRFLFNEWYKKLFRFKENLETDYQKLLRKLKPTKNHKSICVQIRVGGKRNNSRYNDMFFMYRNESFKYWNFIKENFITKKKLKDFRIFLTTDTFDVVEEAVHIFGNDKVVSSKSNITNIAHYQKIKRDEKISCNDFRFVYIDFLLLGQCDMGLISASGFGYYGVLNRENKNYDDFYVYTRHSYADNRLRYFKRFDPSGLY